jgi:hypothetical protein
MLIQGCVSVTDTLYLQDVEVFGPISQPPVAFMNSDKKICISPKIYLNGTKRIKGQVTGHSKVNSDGVFAFDSSFDDSGNLYFREKRGENRFDYEGENLTWNIPDYMIGFDIDYYMAPKLILTAGLSISEVDQKNLYGWKVGIGFGGFEGDFGLRFDAGLIWQEYAYNAETVVIRETSSWFEEAKNEVFFYSDKGNTTNLNHYFSLILHYADNEAIANPFISVARSFQKILDYEPQYSEKSNIPFTNYRNEDLRGGAGVSYWIITPGSSFFITENIKFIVSAKYFFAGNIDNVSRKNFVIPTLQFDFLF